MVVEAAATVEAKVLLTIHQVQAYQRVEAVVGVLAAAIVKAVVKVVVKVIVEAVEVTMKEGKKVRIHSRLCSVC